MRDSDTPTKPNNESSSAPHTPATSIGEQPAPASGDTVALSHADEPHDSRRFFQGDGLLLFAIVLVALAIRIVYVFQLRQSPLFDHPTLDAKLHYDWAKAILAGENLFEGAYFRAPLYPWFLSAIYAITGPGFLAPRLIQAVIGALSCGLMYLIGRDGFSKTIGAVAGLAGATYWVLIYYDGELLLEPLSIFLNLLAVWLLLRAGHRGTLWEWTAAGIVLGLSAINRPNVLAIMPFLAIWIVLVHRPRLTTGMTRAIVFAVACAVPILPITIRNYVVGDDFVLIASQGGPNFYIGNNPKADGKTPLLPGARRTWSGGRQDWTTLAETDAGRKLKPSEVSSYYYSEAFAFMRQHPGAAANLMFIKLQYFLNDLEVPNVLNIYFFTSRYTPITRYLPLTFGMVAPFGIVGMWLARRRALSLFPLWGFLIIYSATVVAFFVNARFRIPTVPFFILFAAYAAIHLGRNARRKEWRNLLGAGIAIALLWVCINRGIPAQAYNNPESQCQLGNAFVDAAKPEEATSAFNEALQLDDQYAEARIGMGRSLLLQGRYAEAIIHLKRGLELDPSCDAYDTITMALQHQNRYAEIIKVLRQGIQSLPGNLELNRNLAYFLAVAPNSSLRNGPEAIRLAREVQTIEPDAIKTHHTLALAYAEAGRFRDAIQEANRAIELAKEKDNKVAVERITAHRELFRQHKPFHLPSGGTSP